MQSINIPAKFLVPFANNDNARVELPVTTATAGRASQSLGFPPITGQPPEAGGQPPQLEDFNGAMNQIARVSWWAQLGGKFNYDVTFATSAAIGGYPAGAELNAADNQGAWLNLAENNTANPDTDGSNWAPTRAYGVLNLAQMTGGVITLSPAQAMKRRILLTGVLSSDLTLIVPSWLYSWDVTNSTSGSFNVVMKTSAGAGAVIPQNGAPTPLVGDGTNITQPAANVPAATSPTQAMQFGQATGRLLGVRVFNVVGSSTYIASPGTRFVIVDLQCAGAAGAGTVAALSGNAAVGGGGGGGGRAVVLLSSSFTNTSVTVGAGGVTGGAGNPGGAGAVTSFGALIVGPGAPSVPQGQGTPGPSYQAPGIGGAAPTIATGPNVQALAISSGQQGAAGIILSTNVVIAGSGGNAPYGAGAVAPGSSAVGQTGTGLPGAGRGAGGAGGFSTAGGNPGGGGSGAAGLVLVYEYS